TYRNSNWTTMSILRARSSPRAGRMHMMQARQCASGISNRNTILPESRKSCWKRYEIRHKKALSLLIFLKLGGKMTRVILFDKDGTLLNYQKIWTPYAKRVIQA